MVIECKCIRMVTIFTSGPGICIHVALSAVLSLTVYSTLCELLSHYPATWLACKFHRELTDQL
jgi:hypothetical protein